MRMHMDIGIRAPKMHQATDRENPGIGFERSLELIRIDPVAVLKLGQQVENAIGAIEGDRSMGKEPILLGIEHEQKPHDERHRGLEYLLLGAPLEKLLPGSFTAVSVLVQA